MGRKTAQAGFEVGFMIFAIFYMAFLTFTATQWPGAAGITGSVSVPTLPPQPGILDYLIWPFTVIYYYLASFLSFNIAIPWLGLLSVVIALVGVFIGINVIRGR